MFNFGQRICWWAQTQCVQKCNKWNFPLWCNLRACFLIALIDVHIFTSSVCHVNTGNFDFDVRWMLTSLCPLKVCQVIMWKFVKSYSIVVYYGYSVACYVYAFWSLMCLSSIKWSICMWSIYMWSICMWSICMWSICMSYNVCHVICLPCGVEQVICHMVPLPNFPLVVDLICYCCHSYVCWVLGEPNSHVIYLCYVVKIHVHNCVCCSDMQ